MGVKTDTFDMSKGVLLFAAGKSVYGKYAYNLALSIRSEDRDIPIAIIYYGDEVFAELDPQQQKIFTFKILAKKEDLYVGDNIMPSRFKTMINKYNPFDMVVFLDSDSLWFPGKKISWLIYELQKYDFTSYVSGRFDIEEKPSQKVMDWGTVGNFAKAFGIEKGVMSQIHSHFMFWKKDTDAEQLFEKALEVYDAVMNETVDINMTKWAQQVPDEACFAIASAMVDVHPHTHLWTPTADYWRHVGTAQMEVFMEFFLNYWGMTLPGFKQDLSFVELYNFVVNYIQRSTHKPAFLWDGDKFNKEEESNAVNDFFPVKTIIENNF